MDHLIKEILVEEEAIRKKVAELGAKITEDYKGKDLVLVGILKGAVIFMSDLARNIKMPLAWILWLFPAMEDQQLLLEKLE